MARGRAKWFWMPLLYAAVATAGVSPAAAKRQVSGGAYHVLKGLETSRWAKISPFRLRSRREVSAEDKANFATIVDHVKQRNRESGNAGWATTAFGLTEHAVLARSLGGTRLVLISGNGGIESANVEDDRSTPGGELVRHFRLTKKYPVWGWSRPAMSTILADLAKRVRARQKIETVVSRRLFPGG
jgi:hypothetical protein